MPDTEKRLFGPAQLTNSAATKYTTPASTKTKVKHIHLYNADSTTRTVTISIGADAAGTRILDAYPIAATSEYDRFADYVLEATEIIQAFADQASKVTMTIDGVENTLG